MAGGRSLYVFFLMSHPTWVIAALATQLGDGDWDEISSLTIVLVHSKRHTLNPICPSELLQKHHENLLQWMALAGVSSWCPISILKSLCFLSYHVSEMYFDIFDKENTPTNACKYIIPCGCIMLHRANCNQKKVTQSWHKERGSNNWLWPVQTFTATPANASLDRNSKARPKTSIIKPVSTNPLARPDDEK